MLRRGDHLFRSGDPLRDAFRVVGGAFKSYVVHLDGHEQIIGFYLPGDLIGYESLDENSSAFTSVVALDTSCVVQESIGTSGGGIDPERLIYQSMRQEILRLTRLLYMERSCTETRLARFLVDFAEAQRSRGYDRHDFRLPMGRKDLARYLGLVPETVSRVFGRLRERGVLSVDNNHIRILDHAALTAIAAGEDI